MIPAPAGTSRRPLLIHFQALDWARRCEKKVSFRKFLKLTQEISFRKFLKLIIDRLVTRSINPG